MEEYKVERFLGIKTRYFKSTQFYQLLTVVGCMIGGYVMESEEVGHYLAGVMLGTLIWFRKFY